jgi:hypothetical protein
MRVSTRCLNALLWSQDTYSKVNAQHGGNGRSIGMLVDIQA